MSQSVWKRGRLLAAGLVAIAGVTAFAVACGGTSSTDKTSTAAAGAPKATVAPKTTPTTSTSASPASGSTTTAAELGTTPGWGGGKVATVFYTKPFFCDKTPCEAGTAGTNAPGTSNPVPSVWVLVPLFKDTSGLNFHCPTEGNCVAHPKELDVSKIGLGSVIPLPPHSHIVDTTEAGFSAAANTPWKVVVVGIKTRAAWDMLEQGKSIDTLRQVQAMGDTTATGDVPSNIVLFFGIR
jgi:hypothetical protein